MDAMYVLLMPGPRICSPTNSLAMSEAEMPCSTLEEVPTGTPVMLNGAGQTPNRARFTMAGLLAEVVWVTVALKVPLAALLLHAPSSTAKVVVVRLREETVCVVLLKVLYGDGIPAENVTDSP